MSVSIIIAAPHSKCYNSNVRTCDLRAKYAAETLFDIAKHTYNDVDVELFLSDTYRNVSDLNRDESYNTEWRVLLRNTIMQKSEVYDYVILLETHSYFGTMMGMRDNVPMYLVQTKGNYDVGLMIKSYFEQEGKVLNVLLGNPDINSIQNDIMQMSDKKGKNIFPVLAEFNEDADQIPDDVINDYASTLLKALITNADKFTRKERYVALEQKITGLIIGGVKKTIHVFVKILIWILIIVVVSFVMILIIDANTRYKFREFIMESLK